MTGKMDFKQQREGPKFIATACTFLSSNWESASVHTFGSPSPLSANCLTNLLLPIYQALLLTLLKKLSRSWVIFPRRKISDTRMKVCERKNFTVKISKGVESLFNRAGKGVHSSNEGQKILCAVMTTSFEVRSVKRAVAFGVISKAPAYAWSFEWLMNNEALS